MKQSFNVKAGIRRFFRLAPDHPDQVIREIDDEIDLHIDLRVEQLIERGYSPEDARAEAVRRFGTLDRAQPALVSSATRREHHMRFRHSLDTLRQDLVQAFRALRNQPGFALAVVATLALGIGANAAMFGIVDRLLLRPPAFLRDAGETGRIYLHSTYDGEEQTTNNIPYQRFLDLRDGTSSFAQTVAFFQTELVIGVGESAHQAQVSLVSADVWSFFTLRPELGRFFTAEEDRTPRGSPVAVLSHGYWRDAYGAATDVLGQRITIGGTAYTIIGVAPKGFSAMSLTRPAAFIPITAGAWELFTPRPGRRPWYQGYNFTWMEMVARRKAGVSPQAAEADLTAAYVRSLESERAGRANIWSVEDLRPRVELASILFDRGPKARPSAKVATWLAGVSVLVLLVACANVASLLLARAIGRRREVAVRIALGISRMRLLRYLLTESVLLALAGGIVAIVVAQVASKGLAALVLPGVEWPSPVADARILLFTGCAALLAGLLTGLTPAFQHGDADLTGTLKAGGREGSVRRTHLRGTLIALQGAISVVLLVGAGLFVRSLHNVRAVELGFDADRLMYVGFSMRGTTLDAAQRTALRERMRMMAAQHPAVEAAAATVSVPFWISWNEDLFAPGVDSGRLREPIYANAVSEDYFITTGTPVLRGRPILASDDSGSAPVAVISESVARGVWAGEEALGRCVKLRADTAPCISVVGIVADIRRGFEEAPARSIYFPIAQEENPNAGLFVRTRGPAERSIEAVRRTLQSAMPGTAYVEARSMNDVLDPEIRSWRLGAAMFTLFGGLALLLAAVGLFSVISYSVTQRSHELGVRMALGANARDVLSLVVREGLRIAAIGTAVGVILALFVGRYLAPLLYAVSAKDPGTFAVVVVALLVVASLASAIPARRAMQVDPTEALRGD